jgi:2-polyprenyl-3-methyl-5-hydroxy-6-metoxy-1,4-benzoquinol methylase
MNKNYYSEYFKLERENWWFTARLKIIHAQVAMIAKGNKNLRILNIGAATGATSLMLEEFGKVKSIEYDEYCYNFVKERLGIDLELGSILELRFNNEEYDLVCAFDVIEHVECDTTAVSEMLRVCKKGGHIFITVPAFMFLWGAHDIVNQHYRRYLSKQLKNLLSKSSILYLTYFNSILFMPIAVIRLLSKIIPIKRKGAGSDFGILDSKLLNFIFYKTFLFEKTWMTHRVKMPCGVSLLAIAMKK